MPRHRAVAIVIRDQKLLVMFRKNDEEYYVFPGGGIEEGETPEIATIREIDEESSIDITIDRLLYELRHENGDIHYFFLADYVSGEPAIRSGTNEAAVNETGDDFHRPMWLEVDSISQVTLYPPEITEQLLSDLQDGFKNTPIILQSSFSE